MKIAQIHPGCGISVPPQSWGAIEKIVWEFIVNLRKLGHQVDLKWTNEVKPGEYDFKIIFKKELNYGLYLSALTMLIFFYFFLRFRPNTYRD